MDYKPLVKKIIENIGGKENVISVIHCITRLRFTLKDDSIANDVKIKELDGVMGVVRSNGQYQVIIGTHVGDVFKIVNNELGLDNNLEETSTKDTEKKGNIGSRILKTIASCIVPALPGLVGAGMLKGILAALVGFGLLSAESGTYEVLYGAADALFYFFPIIIGFHAAKVFNMNQTIGAVIGGAHVYPNLVSAETLSFLGINISKTTYSNTIFPIIVALFLASYLYKFLDKHIPAMVRSIFVPTITLLITVPVTYLVIGPVVNGIADGVLAAITWIFATCPPIAGALLGGLWQVLVIFGVHQAIIPMILQEIMTNGFSYIDACVGLSLFGIAGMALGYSLKVKNKKEKSESFGHFVVAMCGVTEPAIYAIGITHIKNFACACIGGACGGLIMAILGGKTYGFGGGALFNAAQFISPEGVDFNLAIWAIGAIVTVVISAVTSYMITKKDMNKEINNKNQVETVNM